MLTVCAFAGRRDRTNSNNVRDTKIDVNRLLIKPTASVVANPRIGPVPNWKRNAAAMSEVTWVSKSVQNTRSKLAATAARAPLLAASSSLMRPCPSSG